MAELARYRAAALMTQGAPTVEVLMDDMFYPGMHGSFFPCVVYETRADGAKLCEISEDADRVRFWAPATNIYPLRPREQPRLDWFPGQHVEVALRFQSEQPNTFEPRGYWPAVVIERVGSNQARIRWTGRYADDSKPIFYCDAFRMPTTSAL